MKKVLLIALAGAALAAAPAGAVAAVSPTVRLAILHTVSGCHVWATETLRSLGPSKRIAVKPGTRLVIRPHCPMAFDFAQVSGPKLALGAARTYPGTSRTILFRKPGVYVLKVTNPQSSAELGLQTLGPDNTLTLVVRVR